MLDLFHHYKAWCKEPQILNREWVLLVVCVDSWFTISASSWSELHWKATDKILVHYSMLPIWTLYQSIPVFMPIQCAFTCFNEWYKTSMNNNKQTTALRWAGRRNKLLIDIKNMLKLCGCDSTPLNPGLSNTTNQIHFCVYIALICCPVSSTHHSKIHIHQTAQQLHAVFSVMYAIG